MKNKLMVLVVIGGLLTASYRFLPPELRSEFDSQLQKITRAILPVPPADAHTERKHDVQLFPDNSSAKQHAKKIVATAYIQRMEDVQVQDEGRVVVVLADDRKSSKHQRFIVRTAEDITVLIAHNIDLAPRIKNIQQGDKVEFYGEYVWNEKGGVVHWTHHDPDGSHVSGWLKHNGAMYQ